MNSKAFIFGHIGDGNLHYYLFNSPELSSNEFYDLEKKLKHQFMINYAARWKL